MIMLDKLSYVIVLHTYGYYLATQCLGLTHFFFSRQDGERREGWFIVVWTLLAECTFICNGCVSKFRCGITKENIFIILHILVSQQAFVEIKLQGARF